MTDHVFEYAGSSPSGSDTYYKCRVCGIEKPEGYRVLVGCQKEKIMAAEPYKRTYEDRLATQKHAVFGTLVKYCGQTLTPALVESIRDELVTEMRQGGTSWAFKPENNT